MRTEAPRDRGAPRGDQGCPKAKAVDERPARFGAPIDPALFDRVQVIRAERRTRHPGTTTSRAYPLVRLMRCVRCGSSYHGDANRNLRRIRHARRPACSPSATYRAEHYEEQIARLFDRVELTEPDIARVLEAMTPQQAPADPAPDREELHRRRADLQLQLANGEVTIEAFTRDWRRLDRPVRAPAAALNEDRLRRAADSLRSFGTLWRNNAIPGRLREEALREIVSRLDIDGPEIVAVHPQPNENAWLLGLTEARQEPLRAQQYVGVVGARGVGPRLCG